MPVWRRTASMIADTQASAPGGSANAVVSNASSHGDARVDRLRWWRCIASRYEKRAANYQAMLTLAAIQVWV